MLPILMFNVYISQTLQEIRKIWRATYVQSFEGQGGKFKPYTPFNRKPLELFEKFIWI